MITKEKNPPVADPFITDMCHCRFISLIMAPKNAYAAVFVSNYVSCGSAKLKAFEGMSFSSLLTAQQLHPHSTAELFTHLTECLLGVIHD